MLLIQAAHAAASPPADRGDLSRATSRAPSDFLVDRVRLARGALKQHFLELAVALSLRDALVRRLELVLKLLYGALLSKDNPGRDRDARCVRVCARGCVPA